MQTIRLITFDVTNTLIKFKSSVGYEYCKIADLYGIKCNNENTVKAINSNFAILMKQLKKESPFYGVTEGINCNQWWHRLVFRTFSVSGIEMSPEMESKLKLTSTHLYKLFSTAEPYQLMDGVEDTLSALQKNGRSIQIGVISNSDERLPKILTQLGIGHFFQFIILPQFLRAAKPDPKVFQTALDKIDLKDPNQALHIGDDLVKDYLAAKNCKWNALLFGKDDSISDAINPKHKIQTIKELTYDSIVEKLN